jgi:hypothetical protein
MKTQLSLFLLLVVLLIHSTYGDVYMHNPRKYISLHHNTPKVVAMTEIVKPTITETTETDFLTPKTTLLEVSNPKIST